MQAFSTWRPPQGVLGALVAQAHRRAEALTAHAAELARAATLAPMVPEFAAALGGRRVAVIAELKRRSPSKGEINPGLSAGEQARAYARGGAAALSILTEPERFGGSLDDVAAARRMVTLPLLKKDFHVSTLQMVEARAAGASAALVIARALAPAATIEMVRAAHEAGIDALVEVRDERELETAIASGARVIGVNNRNLETLEIDPAVGERLVPRIPADRVAVWESGVVGPGDFERAARAGADAVLVGSSVSAAADPAAAVRALATVERVGRGAPVPG